MIATPLCCNLALSVFAVFGFSITQLMMYIVITMILQGKDVFLDPYKDIIWMLMSGSSGPARLGGDGQWWSHLGRECVLHKTTNMSLEIFINVYTMSILHLKYYKFRTGRKLCQNVSISFEICVKVLHLIQHVNISLEIWTTVAGSCVGLSKMLRFHWKYV